MSKISAELLAEKLADWTPSVKVQETLGLSSMDEDSFKKELSALEAKGVVIRDGARRGLKFKFAGSGATAQPAPKAEAIKPIQTKKEKVKPSSNIDARDIDCEVVIFPKHEYIDEVTKVALTQLLSFVLNGTDDSRTMSIKRTSKGVVIKTYRDVYCLSEVTYTKENFKKLLSASNIKLD